MRHPSISSSPAPWGVLHSSCSCYLSASLVIGVTERWLQIRPLLGSWPTQTLKNLPCALMEVGLLHFPSYLSPIARTCSEGPRAEKCTEQHSTELESLFLQVASLVSPSRLARRKGECPHPHSLQKGVAGNSIPKSPTSSTNSFATSRQQGGSEKAAGGAELVP